MYFLSFTLLILEIGANYYTPPLWNYDAQYAWPGELCNSRAGTRQSPINIRTKDVIEDKRMDFIGFDPLTFIGYNRVLVSGINNGHTVQFSSEGDASIHPTITGGPLRHLYRLEQLHFHWLSEHSIDGVKYPMEIHFVHVRAGMSVAKALTKPDGLAIVAMFCNVEIDVDEETYSAVEEVVQHLNKLKYPGNRTSGLLMDMTKLLPPRNLKSYYAYAGSLTTPECDEAVIWIIFDKPIKISDTQYQLFEGIGSGRPNFRKLQKHIFQKVYHKPESYLMKPVIVDAAQKVIAAILQFFHNVHDAFRKI